MAPSSNNREKDSKSKSTASKPVGSFRFSGDEMEAFDDQTASDLEFDAIRALLLSHCHNPTAQDRALKLRPLRNRKNMVRALEESKELLQIKREGHAFPAVGCEEITREIEWLSIREAVLEEQSFQRLRTASITVNDVVEALRGKAETFPRLSYLLRNVYHTTEIIQAIDSVFDAKGQVKSDASAKLVQIREERIRVKRNVNRQFVRVLKDYSERGWLADTKEGFISERRVLAVNSTHKRKVQGSALGQSKNGSITFIEPAINVSLNFELEMLRDDERKEILRILRELTRTIGQFLPLIKAYQKLLVELDWIRAKVQLAQQFGGDLPGLRNDHSFHLIQAYHPLLYMQNERMGLTTEPQTLALHGKARMLVISGPNAGGKSIALKTVGLLQVMLQSGLLVPVHPTSEMGRFDTILTDIGDNQSIENQLSTYSYRLNRMKGFLEHAGPTSLLLLDEFGTGSDPELGGALAEVFFEELYERGCYGVITTHYANIKSRASQLPHAFNGSMRFDRESLEPLFKLDIGTPGSSFTFEVATINGIEDQLIQRAKNKLDGKKVQLDELIGELQKEKNTLAKLTDRSLRKDLELDQLRQRMEAEREHLNERADHQHGVAEEQNNSLNRGRKLQQFVDRYTAESKNKELLEDVRKYLAMERAKLDDASKSAAVKRKAILGGKPKKRPKHFVERIQVGSIVRLRIGGKERGEVIELNQSTALVLFGSFKTRVELTKLTWVAH
ncbi:MAG: DNA mismatch repair protein MutS [Flavobacteriales bacterium]|nr:DNA mismatch repair protein MutS [Flavobacteriales bacterium]